MLPWLSVTVTGVLVREPNSKSKEELGVCKSNLDAAEVEGATGGVRF
jgi:hypothetical protein